MGLCELLGLRCFYVLRVGQPLGFNDETESTGLPLWAGRFEFFRSCFSQGVSRQKAGLKG